MRKDFRIISMKSIIFLLKTLICAGIALSFASCKPAYKDYWGEDIGGNGGGTEPAENPNASKPRYIWIDAAANFPDFANNKENISRDLALAKDAGFTDIVVDVRPTTGDVLFNTSVVEQVKYLYAWIGPNYTKVERTATWDYLQAFIDEARKQGLRVHAAINTFVGGNTINGGTGLLFRDKSKTGWATYLNLPAGITNIMDTGEGTKFFNPVHPEVQTFLCDLLKDLAKYDLDGIFLDRGRFSGFTSDFSDISRKEFEKHLGGIKVRNYPEDILLPGTVSLPASYPTYLTRWLEFRAKVICEFMQKARSAVKSVNPKIKFGVYVGGWYSAYYDVGVNWAASSYDASRYYKWATPKYKNYGYAEFMDQMLIGAYASPLKVKGSTEWTMEGFCLLAKQKIGGKCPIVAGGPDVGNWDPEDKVPQEQENQAIVESVRACMDVCDGYFLFDMIHLKKKTQWQYAKQGIKNAID